MEYKETNPKDLIGSAKVGLWVLPLRVLWGVAVAFYEGALKYGAWNYRAAGVRASVYFDANVARHQFLWSEGEDIDPDSGQHHLDKAIAGLMVLRDSMIEGNWVDDRRRGDPARSRAYLEECQGNVAKLLEKYPEGVRAAPYTRSAGVMTFEEKRAALVQKLERSGVLKTAEDASSGKAPARPSDDAPDPLA